MLEFYSQIKQHNLISRRALESYPKTSAKKRGEMQNYLYKQLDSFKKWIKSVDWGLPVIFGFFFGPLLMLIGVEAKIKILSIVGAIMIAPMLIAAYIAMACAAAFGISSVVEKLFGEKAGFVALILTLIIMFLLLMSGAGYESEYPKMYIW